PLSTSTASRHANTYATSTPTSSSKFIERPHSGRVEPTVSARKAESVRRTTDAPRVRGGEGEIRTLGTLSTYARFRGGCHQPLDHLSTRRFSAKNPRSCAAGSSASTP